MNILLTPARKYDFSGYGQNLKIVSLIIYPLFYLFAGFYFNSLIGGLSLISVDPDYVYFISGLTISEGYFKPGHIDHPGSPLQYLIAIVLRITYLFRKNTGVPYMDDVLGNPDIYISVVNLTLTVIIAVSVFWAGMYVFSKTKSFVYGLIIQTVPFVPFALYETIGRIVPELLFPLPLLTLSSFLIVKITSHNKKYSRNEILLLSIIMAFALSVKLTMISLFVIPLLTLKPWRKKLTFAGFSLLFFLIFSLPATLQIERFWEWITNLFMHSGRYGSGSKNIVDIQVFVQNLKTIAGLYRYFTYFIVFQIFFIPGSYFLLRKKKKTELNKIMLSVSLLLAILIQALITAKHYAPQYFVPAVMLNALLLLLNIEIIRAIFSGRLVLSISAVFLIVFLVWHLNDQIINLNYSSEGIGNRVMARKETGHYIKAVEKESIKIIVSQDYGCPMQEYAILFGTAWLANPLKPCYAEILGKLYPNTYQYTTFDNLFRFWGKEFDLEKIAVQNIPVYVYLENNNEELYEKTCAKLKEISERDFSVQKKLLFENPVNNEVLLQLFFSIQSSEPEITD